MERSEINIIVHIGSPAAESSEIIQMPGIWPTAHRCQQEGFWRTNEAGDHLAHRHAEAGGDLHQRRDRGAVVRGEQVTQQAEDQRQDAAQGHARQQPQRQ